MKRKWDNRKNITTDIAYIAGFFDGEGCIRIKSTPSSHYLIVHITNSNESILKFIQERFGGAINFQEKGKNKTIYQYHLTCGQAYDFLRVVISFLKDKKEQALYGMMFHEIKGKLSSSGRALMARRISEMKRENPELLTT